MFVDTNVFVYARDKSEGDKQILAERWITSLWRSRGGRLSTQVLNEYYVTVTRKLSPGMAVSDARADVRDLMTWRPVPVTHELIERSWTVEDQFGFSHWDSLIVAAAQIAGCEQLLSEDMQDGQQLSGVKVVNPFVHGPRD